MTSASGQVRAAIRTFSMKDTLFLPPCHWNLVLCFGRFLGEKKRFADEKLLAQLSLPHFQEAMPTAEGRTILSGMCRVWASFRHKAMHTSCSGEFLDQEQLAALQHFQGYQQLTMRFGAHCNPIMTY